MLSKTASSPNIFPLLLVNFIGMLGYSIVIPLLVFMVEKFGGNAFIYGVLGSIYPLFQLVGAPLLGQWSDDIGRKRILLVSQVGTLIAWILFIIALVMPRDPLMAIDSQWLGSFSLSVPLIVLFVARALDGLTGGNVSVANAYLSDISTEKNRKANFGKMASSTSLGFIVGPAAASILAASVYQELIPVIAAAFVSLVAIFVIYRYLPESRQDLVKPDLSIMGLKKLFAIEQRECYQVENCPDTGLRAVLKEPGIPLLFTIYFFTFLGFSFFYSGFPIYASQYLDWNVSQLGLFFMVSSGVMVLVQGPGLSFLSDKVADRFLVSAGSLLILLSFSILPLGGWGWIYGANILLSIGNGIMWPSFLSILSQTGSSKIQGTIQGYANSMGSAASILGLLVGGAMFGQIGTTVFWIAMVMFGIILVLSSRLPSTSGKAEK